MLRRNADSAAVFPKKGPSARDDQEGFAIRASLARGAATPRCAEHKIQL
jgi:hypothetical protein